jgi:hypothetical protein
MARRADRWLLQMVLLAAVCCVVAACYSPSARGEQVPVLSVTVAAAEESVTFGMLEARFDLTSRWLLSVAGAYLDPGPASDETQLRLSAVGALNAGGWSVENRHLFTLSSASIERYRMRVRAIRSGLFGNRSLSVRVFDEVYFDFDSRRLFRNNFALGVGMQVSDAVSGELYQVWEMNRSRQDDAYLLALITFRFGSHHRNL